jgi:hypothetical protein
MEGEFQLRTEDGEIFAAKVARFILVGPQATRR